MLFIPLDCFRDVCLLLNIIEIDGARLSVRKAAQKNAFEKLNSDVSFQNIMVNQDDIHILLWALSRQGGRGGRHRNDIDVAAIFPLISKWEDEVGVNKLWSFHHLRINSLTGKIHKSEKLQGHDAEC